MLNIGKRYYVFDKIKFDSALSGLLAKKAGGEWASYAVSSISTALVLRGLWEKALASNPAAYIVVIITVLALANLFLLFMFVRSLLSWLKNRRYGPARILSELRDVQVERDMTYVFIVKKELSGVAHVLVLDNEDWGFILPYAITKLELGQEELAKIVAALFPANKFDLEPLPKLDLNDEIKVHPRRLELARFSYRFVFLSCQSGYRDFKNSLDFSSIKRWQWLSLDALRRHEKTMLNNADVILHLNSDHVLDTIRDSFPAPRFVSNALPKNLKIVWNITNKCSFGCSFCATHRDGAAESLGFRERIKIAMELSRLPDPRIDFAGGDPLGDPDAVEAIRAIAGYIILDDVSITTTGKSMEKFEPNELASLAHTFDVSYDFPSSWPESHRGAGYNRTNYAQLRRLGHYGIRRNVLTTLSESNVAPEVVEAMIGELRELDPDEITLLRLMPVGRQAYGDYPTRTEYDPSSAIEMFLREFDGKTKLHCAFRADKRNGYCNMLREKIGIDHMGNVFACAWAGYLSAQAPTENPFYLGNLVVQSIDDLFKGERYTRMMANIDKCDGGFCRVFSCAAGGDDAIWRRAKGYISWTEPPGAP
jgi:MoaA/NifB/PqqE/SkfB family radical SAM enzyme